MIADSFAAQPFRSSQRLDVGSLLLRRLRREAAEERLLQAAARRQQRRTILRLGSLCAICMAATLVLNEGVNERWSRLILGTHQSDAVMARIDAPQGPTVESQASLGNIVQLGRIEDEPLYSATARPASMSQSRHETRRPNAKASTSDTQPAPATQPSAFRAAANAGLDAGRFESR